MPPVIDREMLEKDDSPVQALDDDDIALLKTYVCFTACFFPNIRSFSRAQLLFCSSL